MRNLTFGLTVALALQGCAFQQAMKHGETAAAADEWADAYDAYRFANSLKPGEADTQVAEALAEAVEIELTSAEAAVTAKEFVAAHDAIDRAAHLDAEHPRIGEVQTAASDALHAELASTMGSVDDVTATYDFVAMAKDLYPHSAAVEDAAVTIRALVATEVEENLAARRYADARVAAQHVLAVEPAQRTLGESLENTVTEAWVAHLLAEAQAAERKQPGLAAVYYLRAHEVGGDAAHLESGATALERAGADAALGVYINTKGSGGRHWRLRKTLREGLSGVAGVDRGRSSSWDLMAVVSANGERCAETSKDEDLEKEFVAGTRQVPNPDYAEVTEALDKAEGDLKAVDTERDEKRSAMATAQAQLRSLEEDRARKDRVHTDASKDADATREQITASAQRVEDVKTELKNSEANDTAIAQTKEQLSLLEGFHSEWKTKLEADTKAVNEAKEALDGVDAELGPQKTSTERLVAETADAEERHKATTKLVADLRAKQHKTDEELTEDVIETAKYAETTWTFACEAPATVRFSTRWNTELDKKRTIDAKNHTTDVSRPAHAGAEIKADEKAYPLAKDELVAKLDASTTGAVAESIEAFVAESFAKTLEIALAATDDVGDATHTLLTVYAGARSRVDESSHAKLVEHLKSHYGLEDASLLDADAPEEEAPPADG